MKGREPTEQEVIENLEDDVDPIVIRKILHGEINGEGQVDIENIMTKLRDRNAMTSLVQNTKNDKSAHTGFPSRRAMVAFFSALACKSQLKQFNYFLFSY